MRRQLLRTGAAASVSLLLLVGVATAASADVAAPPDTSQAFAQWERQLAARSAASRLPSSTLSSGATASTRIAGASRAITTTAATGQITVSEATTALSGAQKFGVIAKGGTAVVTAVTGFDLGYSATGWYMTNVFGIRSDGFVCDVSQLVGDSSCVPALSDQVVPNADVAPVRPGWAYVSGMNSPSPLDEIWWGGGDSRMRITVTEQADGYLLVDGQMIQGANTPTGLYYTNAPDATFGGTGWSTLFVAAGWMTTGATFTQRVKAVGIKIQSGSWFWAKGTPQRPPDVVANPERWWHTEWQCEAGPVQTADSAHFFETDPEFPAFPQTTCDGASLSRVTISEYGAGVDPVPVYDWSAPQQLQDWQQAYPECADATCVLELQRVDAATGARLACFDNPSLCADWLTDPAKTDNYRCTYGTHDVALDECNVYGPTFKAPAEDGSVQYGDPQDGTGTSSTAAPLPAVEDGCPPPFTWTSMVNPWWYYKGAVCAMQKVFVPSTALQTSKVTTAWNASALGQVGGVVSNLGAGFAAIGGGECGVITDSEPVPLLGWHLVIDTCAWPWSAAGPLKRIIGIAFLLGAIVIGVRTVLRIIRADVVVDGSEK